MAKTEQETAAVDTAGNAEVIVQSVRLDDSTLRGIGSFEDALKVMQGVGDIAIADAEIGNGFAIATEKDKDRLVGVPVAFLSWTFNEGDYGSAEDGSNVFVSAYVVTQDGGKYIVNDGSTGIRKQLQEYTKRSGNQVNLVVRNGLRKSEYFIDRDTKKPVARGFEGPKDPASTYYIDTSA